MIQPVKCNCGEEPSILPYNPEKDGNVLGIVKCMNKDCPVQPSVYDDIQTFDERGSNAYKERAIIIWNQWFSDEPSS